MSSSNDIASGIVRGGIRLIGLMFAVLAIGVVVSLLLVSCMN
jgi:hypothetical protein